MRCDLSMKRHHRTGNGGGSLRRPRIGATRALLLAALAALGAQGRAAADVLYGASGAGNTLFSVDTTTGVVSNQFTTPNPNPDDLVTYGLGQVLYLDQGYTGPEDQPAPATGQLRLHNFITGADTLIATGFSRPADLTLDPSRQNVYLTESSSNSGRIDRVNLATGTVTALPGSFGAPNGIVFDGAGRLFADIGTRFGGSTGSSVAQIDPTTGAILHMSPGINSADGLAYDPVTGRLYTASALSPTLYSFNPNNLETSETTATLPSNADGVISNNAGLLYIGGRGTSGASIYTLNTATGAITTTAFVAGASSIDLTLAPAAVPEPGPIALAGLGLLAVAGSRYVRKAVGRKAG